MKFRKLFKESFLVMAWVLGFIWTVSKIEINSDILNPVSAAFKDFDLTDIVFSHIRESPQVDSNIVLVNIGNLDRGGVGALVNVINEYHPRAIGIDAFFRKPKNPVLDSALSQSFAQVNHMILVSELYENPSNGTIDSMGFSNPMFMQYATPAFADMIAQGKHSLNTARACIPKEIFNGDTVLSFPTKLAQLYDKEKVNRYLARDHDFEIINYQGNINTYEEGSVSNSKTVFTALDWDQVLNKQMEPEVLKDKIVLMGFMGEHIGENNWQDKFCTPLNSQYVGRTAPDMYGVVVHANIVSMILKENYINDMPAWLNMSVTLVFIFLNIWLFSWLHLNTGEWWDGISMVISLIGVLFLWSVTIVIFDRYNYKFDIGLASVALLLSGNLIELYWGLIKPLYFRLKEKYVSSHKLNKPTT